MNIERRCLLLYNHSGLNVDFIRSALRKGADIYFCGIGGIGTSALAELLFAQGVSVRGSDVARGDAARRLEALGIPVLYTQTAENITNAPPDLFVYSMSISEDNPEYLAALHSGVPAVSRAELLGAVMKDYGKAVTVSGSHGKSTVTAMIGSILSEAGAEPTVISGSDLGGGSSLRLGKRDFLVAEACEYCDSFLKLFPTHALLLNVDFDHADYFGSLDDVCRSFALAARLPSALTVYSADDERLRLIGRELSSGVSFGCQGNADFVYGLTECGAYFTLYFDTLPPISLKIPGEHNARNAAAAATLAITLGVPSDAIVRALSEFRGIPRRLELIGKVNSARVYYDYGHHPKEILTTLDTLKKMRYNNIAVVFAPHTFSRTEALFEDFAAALSGAGKTVILSIFGAREMRGNVSEGDLASRINALGGCAVLSEDLDSIFEEAFDCILLLGAGDLTQIRQRIKEYEKNHSSYGSCTDSDRRNNRDGNCGE